MGLGKEKGGNINMTGKMKEYMMKWEEDMMNEPDLSSVFGADIEIYSPSAILEIAGCYDVKIREHIALYGRAEINHAHFTERVTYYQARKRNLLVLWAEVTDKRRESEPF